ncbi:HAD family hydrolase [uncultured Robinsoniella sp.]|uniref:HAD family hydrolase n=1 Tax=uncultured Robinsoniella sp. TaxID=904190 RepID=UPI00374E27F2
MKAVFMDYTGTTVEEKGIEIEQVVMRICKNSELKNPKDALVRWWKGLKQYEESSYEESYLTEDEIVDCLLRDFEQEIGLKDNLEELHSLIQNFWVNAPLFPDVKAFYEKCPVPIYIISNNGIQYVEKSMTDKGLTPAGIVCADMVRAYKPHKEIFEKALELSGFSSSEVIHIGDSYASDVQGAMNAGIKPVLVQRKTKEDYPDTIVVNGLQEVLSLIK